MPTNWLDIRLYQFGVYYDHNKHMKQSSSRIDQNSTILQQPIIPGINPIMFVAFDSFTKYIKPGTQKQNYLDISIISHGLMCTAKWHMTCNSHVIFYGNKNVIFYGNKNVCKSTGYQFCNLLFNQDSMAQCDIFFKLSQISIKIWFFNVHHVMKLKGGES